MRTATVSIGIDLAEAYPSRGAPGTNTKLVYTTPNKGPDNAAVTLSARDVVMLFHEKYTYLTSLYREGKLFVERLAEAWEEEAEPHLQAWNEQYQEAIALRNLILKEVCDKGHVAVDEYARTSWRRFFHVKKEWELKVRGYRGAVLSELRDEILERFPFPEAYPSLLNHDTLKANASGFFYVPEIWRNIGELIETALKEAERLPNAEESPTYKVTLNYFSALNQAEETEHLIKDNMNWLESRKEPRKTNLAELIAECNETTKTLRAWVNDLRREAVKYGPLPIPLVKPV